MRLNLQVRAAGRVVDVGSVGVEQEGGTIRLDLSPKQIGELLRHYVEERATDALGNAIRAGARYAVDRVVKREG